MTEDAYLTRSAGEDAVTPGNVGESHGPTREIVASNSSQILVKAEAEHDARQAAADGERNWLSLGQAAQIYGIHPRRLEAAAREGLILAAYNRYDPQKRLKLSGRSLKAEHMNLRKRRIE